MIIDFHVHIFPPHVKIERSSYLAADPVFRELYQNPKARIADTEDLILSMDRAGIDVSVVQGFAWADNDLCRETNDYIQESAARNPRRLIPFCAVRPELDAGVQDDVQRRLQSERPVRGAGEMRLDAPGCRADGWAALRPLYDLAAKEGLPMLVHPSEPVGHPYAGKGGMTPDLVYDLITTFPDWTVVLAHLGGGLPFYTAMPEVKAAMQNVYIDTAARQYLYRPEVFPALVALFDYRKILFATDFPLLDQAASLAKMRALPLEPGVLAAILGTNAARLLGLDDG